jgi:outer membrane lipoprotein-sorting protein
MNRKLLLPILMLLLFCISFAQTNDEKAELVIKKSIDKLGGDKYLAVKTSVGRGFLTTFREGEKAMPSTFLDILVFPDKERTEFKSQGEKIVQVNFGGAGWIFEGGTQTIREQSKEEIVGFSKSLRTSIDYLLRKKWAAEAKLSYVGRREASLGKRNEVVKLTFSDGFVIEYEFSATENLPQKSLYKKTTNAGEESKEEDRYAQFLDFQGIFAPFVIDHFKDGKQTSRINYESIEFNRTISDSIFNKPSSPKELKKDLKF